MKRYGNPKLRTGEIQSNVFASPEAFNKLVVNDISEVDQGSLDQEVIIFNKADDQVYVYHPEFDSWKAVDDKHLHPHMKTSSFPDLVIDEVNDVYNAIHFDRIESNYISVEPDLFDFGPIGSPIDFVIDFWITSYYKSVTEPGYGTILYNGLNTGQVDLENNKNLLITTSDMQLLKNPNYQDEPIRNFDTYSNRDNYIHVMRPELHARRPLPMIRDLITHVALIRSGDTTYLAVNGKIEDSAPSVEYFHYDDVLFGAGYVEAFNGQLINFRVSKNTDRGWTTDFTPPNLNPVIDVNTDFLLGSDTVTDTTGKYTVNVNGTVPEVSQNRFYHQLTEEDVGKSITTNLVQDKLVLRLPDISKSYSFEVHAAIPIEILSVDEHHSIIGDKFNKQMYLDFKPNQIHFFTVQRAIDDGYSTILHHDDYRFPEAHLIYRLLDSPNVGGSFSFLWIPIDDTSYNTYSRIAAAEITAPTIVEKSLVDGCSLAIDCEVSSTFTCWHTTIEGYDRNLVFDFVMQLKSNPPDTRVLVGQANAATTAYDPSLVINANNAIYYRNYFFPWDSTGNPLEYLFTMEVGVSYHIMMARSKVTDSFQILWKKLDADEYEMRSFRSPNNSTYDRVYPYFYTGPWYVSHIRYQYDMGTAELTEHADYNFKLYRHSKNLTHQHYLNQHVRTLNHSHMRFDDIRLIDDTAFWSASFNIDDEVIHVCESKERKDFTDMAPYVIDEPGPAIGINKVVDCRKTGTRDIASAGTSFNSSSWSFDFFIKPKPGAAGYLYNSAYTHGAIYLDSHPLDSTFRLYAGGWRYPPNNELIHDEWYHMIIYRAKGVNIGVHWKHIDADDYFNLHYNYTGTEFDSGRFSYHSGSWLMSNLRCWRKPAAVTDVHFEHLKYPKAVTQNRMLNHTIGKVNETIW